ncbi:MAG: hypothetical protein HQK52_11860 [Oligoflexia bacterium]|nr:hypothetical protein [Oligoflexia bacterium]
MRSTFVQNIKSDVQLEALKVFAFYFKDYPQTLLLINSSAQAAMLGNLLRSGYTVDDKVITSLSKLTTKAQFAALNQVIYSYRPLDFASLMNLK